MSYELRLMQNLPSKVDEGQRRQAVTQVGPGYYDHSRELGCDTQRQSTPCVGMRLLQLQVLFGLSECSLHDWSGCRQLLLEGGVQLHLLVASGGSDQSDALLLLQPLLSPLIEQSLVSPDEPPLVPTIMASNPSRSSPLALISTHSMIMPLSVTR